VTRGVGDKCFVPARLFLNAVLYRHVSSSLEGISAKYKMFCE
jgi:hypothetical protein